MISENLLCGGLPSPVLRRDKVQSEPYHYFPEPSIEQRQGQSVGSLESNESQQHESEVVDKEVLTRGEEASGGAGKRGSWYGEEERDGVGRRRSLRWKGIDV